MTSRCLLWFPILFEARSKILLGHMAPAAATAEDPGGNTDTAVQPMADCEGMVGEMRLSLPKLCAEQRHYKQQSDQATTITVPAALLNAR